jgi:phenylacetate-coenzyme A ligase PaaK-like adenylate-forming protein
VRQRATARAAVVLADGDIACDWRTAIMIRRLDVLSAAWEVWRAKAGGSASLMARQQQRLQALITFARTNSAFYQRLYQHLPDRIARLSDLPPVSKRELMAHFEEWTTDPRVRLEDVRAFIADPALIGTPYLDRYTVWRTSGTTGSPGIFLHDREAVTIYIALLLVRYYLSWASPREAWQIARRRWRTAFVYATGGHFATNAFERITHRLRPGADRNPPVFSAHLPLPDLVHALNDSQPAVLATYPSVLAALTGEQAAGRLRIHPLLIATGGESLKPSVRSQASAAFGCKVRDAYAASEFMGIAFECSAGQLHLNNDWVILEPVDENYRPLPPGAPPHTVLLTNLANRVQPFIRYQMGDNVSLCAEPCPCGSPLPVIVVEGRDDEILSFETPDGQRVAILPLPLATVVMVIEGVQRFQLIQTGAKTLTIRLSVTADAHAPSVWQTVFERLRAYLDSQGLPSVMLQRSDEAPMQATSGKFRHVWSEAHAQQAADRVK